MACVRTIPNLGRLYAWRSLVAAFGFLGLILASGVAWSAPLPATVSTTISGGYARLVFSAAEYIDATTRLAGNVLIITFKRPVNVTVDRIPVQAADYIGAARRDPDGMAVRMALAQKVTVHAIAAGEKFFIDLLPDSWSGVPPGLPQDVIDDLARRAREAEKILQRDRHAAEHTKLAPIRVHVATQPTFTRYIFDITDQTSVSTERSKDRLVLNFDAPLSFDLADAQVALPSTIEGLTSELEADTSLIRFAFGSKVDVRTFRDEKGYVVDVVDPSSGDKPSQAGQTVSQGALPQAALPQGPTPQVAPPETAPATKPAVEGAAAPPAAIAVVPPAKVETPKSAAPAIAAAPVQPPAAAVVSPPAPALTLTAAAAPVAPMQQSTTPPAPANDNKQSAANTVEKPVAAAIAATPVTPSAPSPPPAAKASASADATVPPSAPTPDAVKQSGTQNGDKISVEIARDGGGLKLTFPFAVPTGAAVFHRADALWLVFDAKADVDLTALDGEPSRTIRGYEFRHAGNADVVKLKLDRPHLSSVSGDGSVWTLEIGDSVLEPTRALDITRNVIGSNRSSVSISLEKPQHVHRIADSEVGDNLFVVTALPPARGFINEQDFIEFRALASTQGVVIEPLADDINVELAADKIVIGRPSGLTLSASMQTLLRAGGLRPVMFDSQVWGLDREATYMDRQSHLLAAAAAAPENKRLSPRLDLARFYLARDMYPEAKGVLDVTLADDRSAAEVVSAAVLRSIAEVMMNRPEDALKDLGNPAVGDQHDAPLWRALAYAHEGKWAQAREGFKSVEAALATLPVELQRVALKDEMRSAIEVGDYDSASNTLNDFQTIGVPHDMEPVIAVLMGRLAEGMGRPEEALAAYRTAADSWDRPAAAQGLLRETALRYRLGDLKRDDVINQLESLTTIWRGDETEIEALKLLAHLYTEDGHYRDAFYVMRSAMAAHPDSAMTRQIQDEAAATFDSLFLAGKGDAMPVIDALALFYDFRELTPVGNRGDEMIRRLADRLVSIDLLDQASDLLQYQVDHRLQGAARAQIATRLAVIYLMDRKPDRALAALRATRIADLSSDLRNQRLLLEARALSDMGRHDLALEVTGNIDGREAIRLRSDIMWAARRWDESAEQIELMYGDRYKDFAPLSDVERQDILRAEIGYALADDALGMGRFREKYAAKMAQTPDARPFQIVSAPLGTSGNEFGEIAHAAASVDTLEGFLRDMKARYPDASPVSPAAEPLPAAGASPTVSAQPPDTRPAAPVPPAKAAGRTAQL